MDETVKEAKEKLKFFDKPIPLMEATGNISSYVEELRQCLESEDVTLSQLEIVRLLDIYVRIIGLDRNVSKDGLCALYSLCGVINLEDISNSSPEVVDKCKKAIALVNTLADEDKRFTEEQITYITEHINVIFKEFPIFINELFVMIQAELIENKSIAVYHAVYKAENDTAFMISASYVSDLEDLAFDIVSNVICTKVPKNVAIIVNTFSKATQEKLKANSEAAK